jgi:hypothetical protein
MIHAHLGMRGEYRVEVLNAEKTVLKDTGWMPNIITNTGLDRIGQRGSIGPICMVGTGTSTPIATNTWLDAQIASTSNLLSTNKTNAGPPLYQTQAVFVYQFALGAVVGNVTEVAVGWTAANLGTFSRALTVDGSAVPTAITVLVSEILQVTYRLTTYPPVTDVTGNVTISSVVYAYTARVADAALVLDTNVDNIWFNTLGSSSFTLGLSTGTGAAALNAITGSPLFQGGQAGIGGAYLAYTPGSFFLDFSSALAIGNGNFGGINTAYTQINSIFRSQIAFNPAFAKDATKALNLTMRISWGRYP